MKDLHKHKLCSGCLHTVIKKDWNSVELLPVRYIAINLHDRPSGITAFSSRKPEAVGLLKVYVRRFVQYNLGPVGDRLGSHVFVLRKYQISRGEQQQF